MNTFFKRSAICALAFAMFFCLCPFSLASDMNLPNFAQVSTGLYRGAAPTPAGLVRLKSMGVKIVIDLRGGKLPAKEKIEAQKLGLVFINLPMSDMAPTKKEVATFLAVANNAAASPVYVHCQHGADRTGCLCGIYRETHDHWTYDKAYAEMRHYGFKPYYTNLSKTVKAMAGK
jgi:protein tyrosine/serine phosphatase